MNPTISTCSKGLIDQAPTYHNIIEKIKQLYKENDMTYTEPKAGDITAIRKDTSTVNHFMNNGWTPEEVYELAKKLIYIKKNERYAGKDFWSTPNNLYYLFAQREQIAHYYEITIRNHEQTTDVRNTIVRNGRDRSPSSPIPSDSIKKSAIQKAPDWESFLSMIDQIPNIPSTTKEYFNKLTVRELPNNTIIIYDRKTGEIQKTKQNYISNLLNMTPIYELPTCIKCEQSKVYVESERIFDFCFDCLAICEICERRHACGQDADDCVLLKEGVDESEYLHEEDTDRTERS